MYEVESGAVLRLLGVYLHLLAFAGAFAAVIAGDMAVLRGQAINQRLLRQAARAVTWTLVALWLTGLGIIWLDTGFALAEMLARDKLLAKLSVVTLLSLNGLALHHLAFPRLSRTHADPARASVLPAVLAGVSGCTWLYAAFLGVAKALAPALGYSGFMALYAAALALALLVALVLVRPRLAQRLSAA